MSKFQAAVVVCALGACATHTPSPQQTYSLEQKAAAALSEMISRDPGLPALLSASEAYAVFPDVGAAGAIVGGAFGKGILYERGRPMGYVEVKQGSIGLQLGGQTYSELIVLRNRADVEALKAGSFKMGAGMSAVAIKTGAAAAGSFAGGTSVFVMTKGGLMADISVSGQTVAYRPLPAG
jgi:lipid-binding SYLF domain-containing protein